MSKGTYGDVPCLCVIEAYIAISWISLMHSNPRSPPLPFLLAPSLVATEDPDLRQLPRQHHH